MKYIVSMLVAFICSVSVYAQTTPSGTAPRIISVTEGKFSNGEGDLVIVFEADAYPVTLFGDDRIWIKGVNNKNGEKRQEVRLNNQPYKLVNNGLQRRYRFSVKDRHGEESYKEWLSGEE